MRLILYFFIFSSFGFTFAPQKSIRLLGEFPIPPKNKNMLYYIQRTTNTNTIVYELNFDEDSILNEDEPIHVYWIRYADDGRNAELSYIQKHYAYGLDSEPIGNGDFKFHFVSYKKIDFYLMKSKTDHQYHAYISLNNKLTLLQKIFVSIEGGTFWFPTVKYIEITGVNPETDKDTIQKIIP